MGKAARALAVGSQPLLATDYAAISSTGCPLTQRHVMHAQSSMGIGNKRGRESISTKKRAVSEKRVDKVQGKEARFECWDNPSSAPRSLDSIRLFNRAMLKTIVPVF